MVQLKCPTGFNYFSIVILAILDYVVDFDGR